MSQAPIIQCGTTKRFSVGSGKCMYPTEEAALTAYKDFVENKVCSHMEQEVGTVHVGLYTIPGTGTRFAERLLDHLGVIYSARHTDDPQPCFGLKRIVMVRNPYDTYLSHANMKEPRHTKSDLEFISTFAEYIWNTSHMDAFYLPLDIEPDYRDLLIAECASFCGVDRKNSIGFKWENRDASERDMTKEVSSDMKKHLRFAYNWYQHYTAFWGRS